MDGALIRFRQTPQPVGLRSRTHGASKACWATSGSGSATITTRRSSRIPSRPERDDARPQGPRLPQRCENTIYQTHAAGPGDASMSASASSAAARPLTDERLYQNRRSTVMESIPRASVQDEIRTARAFDGHDVRRFRAAPV